MGTKAPAAPAAPDPRQTAAAQGAANRDTAVTQQAMNFVDQVGPDGSLTYTRGQDQVFTDSLTGQQYSIPKYTATTTLSSAQQALKDINDSTEKNIATIGNQQSQRIGELLGKPVSIGNEDTEARLYDLGSKRLDPQFARQEDALRTRLTNQGIRPGSAAWNAEMTQFQQGQNDAYNSLLLSGRGQAVQEQLAERNQPINEISALLNGSQVSQPNFINTPQTQVAGTDYQGAVRDNFNAQMQAYQTKVGQQNAMMGGLFGLAGTLGGTAARFAPMAFSDRRLKTDIKRVSTLPNGLPVYTFRYVWGGPVQAGLMSDEVRALHPDAVVTIGGFDAVDYAKAVL